MTLRQAAVRVERYLGGLPVDPRTALLWATAAELVLRETANHQTRHDASLRADALQADEYVTPLAPVLRGAQADAVKLLAQVTSASPGEGHWVVPRATARLIQRDRSERLRPEEARVLFDRIQAILKQDGRRRLTLDWLIAEDDEGQ
jgi:hypothetical protein